MRYAVVIALCVTGCGGKSEQVDAQVEDPPASAAIPAVVNRDLDILFVIDDSSSMAQKQDSLGAAFPALVKRLSTTIGGLPNLHVGVITTDMGTSFSSGGQPAPPIGILGNGGCAERGKAGNLTVSGAPVTGSFLVDTAMPDGTRQKNYTGDLSTVFAQMARVGVGGCAFEQPLAAMRAALENNPMNAGFLRPQGNLAVIFLTDEDDCSARSGALFGPESAQLGTRQSFRCTRFGVRCEINGATPDQMNQVGDKGDCGPNATSELVDDTQPYKSFLETLRPSERLFILSLTGRSELGVELRDIGGVTQPALKNACTFTSPAGLQTADPAARLAGFADDFMHGYGSLICNSDLSANLEAIGTSITETIGTPCLRKAPLDVDPNTPGLQFDCVAREYDLPRITPIGECNPATSPPCWKLVEDATACPFAPNLRFEVTRVVEPSPSTVTALFCSD